MRPLMPRRCSSFWKADAVPSSFSLSASREGVARASGPRRARATIRACKPRLARAYPRTAVAGPRQRAAAHRDERRVLSASARRSRAAARRATRALRRVSRGAAAARAQRATAAQKQACRTPGRLRATHRLGWSRGRLAGAGTGRTDWSTKLWTCKGLPGRQTACPRARCIACANCVTAAFRVEVSSLR